MVTRELEEVDLQINNFMKQHEISAEHAIELLGNYYDDKPTTTWDGKAKEESVNEITQGF